MLGALLYPVKQFCYILLVLPSKNCPTLTQPPTSIAHCFVSQYTQDSDAGRDWGQEEKRTTEDEMAGWHHWLDGRESEWTPGAGDGQGGLACCDSWGCKESDTSEQLNWTDTLLYLRWITNVQPMELFSVMCWPGWEQGFGENGYMHLYGWVPLLFTWNCHIVVNRLYPQYKIKSL